MQRLRELDSLRGLAALGVVLHHGLFLTGALPRALVDHLRSSPFQVFVLGRPFVLLFFVLSGFVLSRSLSPLAPAWRTYGIWSLQRAIRLILPAAASVALSAILYRLAFSGSWPGETPWMQLLSWAEPPTMRGMAAEASLAALGSLNNPLWTLIIEMRISLLIPLLVWFARSRDEVIALGVGVLGILALAGGSQPWSLWVSADPLVSLQSLLYFVFPFVLGICLDKFEVCAVPARPVVSWAAAFAVVGLARASFDLAAILGAGLSIWLVQQPGAVRAAMHMPVLTWLGRISFSLYLVHVPLLVAAFHWLHGGLSALVIAGLAIAAALPAAWVFHLVIEGPAHRLARALGARRGLPSAALVRQ